MNRSLIFVAYAVVTLFTAAYAATDDEKKLLATGPLIVDPMPEHSQWSVSFTYSDTPKPGDTSRMDRLLKAAQQDPALARALKNPQYVLSLRAMRPKLIVVTKSGDIRHEERVMEQGEKEESWRVNNVEVERHANFANLDAKIMSRLTTDFPEFEWIRVDKFSGIKNQDGHKYFLFEETMHAETGEEIGTAAAYIDIDTRYPAFYSFRNEIRKYTILTAPSAALTVPAEFAQAGKELMAQIEKSTPHLSAP